MKSASTISRQRIEHREQLFRGGVSISASKTRRGARPVNRNVSLWKVGRTVIFLGRRSPLSKGPPDSPYLATGSERLRADPGTRGPQPEEQWRSIRAATVRHCSLLRQWSEWNIAIGGGEEDGGRGKEKETNRDSSAASPDALPPRIHQVPPDLLHFNLRSLETERRGEAVR